MIDKPAADDGNNEDSRTKITNDPGNSGGLFSDPDYKQLMNSYQHAHFDECEELLRTLFTRYPDHPRLVEFQKDLDLQLSLKQLEHKHEKVARTNIVRKTLKMSAFTIFSIVVVIVIFLGSYIVLSNLISQGTRASKETQIAQLEQQVIDLLNSGQPAVAVELVERIRRLDEKYPSLTELEARTNTLLEQESQYQSAMNLLADGKDSEALVILRGIELKSPGLWNVSRLILQAEQGIQIKSFLTQGDQAYQDEDWRGAIDAYESALALNPDLDDALLKVQLLNSYLRSIIQMLESSSTTVEDIGVAEQYYRKAVAMIPQSRAFASERSNLEQVSSNLLQLKYTQTANALLEEPGQTFSSISSAVSYLNKAVNLDPKNVNLQTALKNAQLYQVAFQNVLEMDWNQAVKNLNQLVGANPGYAAGNASQLLLQSYYELGKKYYDVGLYTDARGFLEQAEILAFNKSENKLQLYQVQMTLGDIIARTKDFENAASYYRYAFNKVNVFNKAPADSRLYILVNAGNSLMDQGDYELAVESFQQAGEEIDEIITLKTISAPDGVTLPLFAAMNFSTTEAIINANKLPQSMTITFGRELQVPTIE